MARRIIATLVLVLAGATLVKADEPSSTFKFSGSIGAAVRNQDAVLTFGGPRLLVSQGDFSASAGFFPSLLYMDGQSPSFRPSLGFGPELNFKHVGLVVPFYYVRSRTVPFFGVSFKF